MTRADDLRWLTAELESERGMGASHAGCDDERELFDRFRALVNTREPKPASGEFLEVQDRVLSGMIEKAGITDAAARRWIRTSLSGSATSRRFAWMRS